jgi:hypothetical protein
MRRLVMVLALLATSAVACADEADSAGGSRSEEGQEYVDAIVASSEDDTASDEENECFARSFVDAVGVDQLQEAVTPDEITENPDSSPGELGITLDDVQADAFWDSLTGCMDVKALFLEGMAEDEDMSEADVECLADALDDDLLKRILVGTLIEGDDFEGDDELMGELFAVFSECPGVVSET